MKEILDYIVARAKERSTWLGIVSLATALGITLNADEQGAVIAFGMALAGLIGVFTRDRAQ